MNDMNFYEAIERSKKIRECYHELEIQHHKTKWTIEEDALAFLTDAGLVGRLTMAQQGRWPKGDGEKVDLEHKLGECIWWLVVLADRMEIDISEVFNRFLTKTENLLEE